MRRLSVKMRIAVWLTVLMTLLSVLLLSFMLVLSSTVARGTAMEQLKEAVRQNLDHITVTGRIPAIDAEFVYYHNGVSTLVYSASETLLAGQLPVTFTENTAFENGVIRTVDAGRYEYLVLDMWVASGWEGGIWVRGLMEAPDSSALARAMLYLALIVLPVFIALAAFGSYRIAKRAFRPLDSITATAEAINEASDLSGRIGLEPGNDEFSRLAADFDQMFERLERSFEAEKQFTSDASHELRTPVSIIKGACEYAEKYDETPEERRETIEMIHRQADRMSALISQLLSMTRMEQGTERMNSERVDLSALAEQIGGELGAVVESSEEPVEVVGDRELLARLLRNLIENGFKYGREGGHVWVTVAKVGDEARLCVRDDGIGIPAEHRDKIWQRFYRVDSSRSSEDSTGLGLAMVDQIARLHGGYMTLESAEGVGSAFTLHLSKKF